MKIFAIALALFPFAGLTQEEQPEVIEKNNDNWTVLVRPSLNPMIYRVINDQESGRNVIFDRQKQSEVRIQYTVKNFLAFRTGLGLQRVNLMLTGASISELVAGDGHSHTAEVFTQSTQYLSIPIEVGFAPKIGKKGGFVPSAFLSLTPHFRFLSDQNIAFNEGMTVPVERQTQLVNDFAGGMRETYTSMNAYAEFMFFVGAKRKFGFGPSFSVNANLNGPQTFLLSRGFGAGAGLNFGWRF